MRIGDLLARDVVDAHGQRIGVCTDVRLWRDRPADDAPAPRLRLAGLIVSPHHTGSLLGYERGTTHRPQPLALAVRRLHRGAFLVAWDDVSAAPDDRESPLALRPGATRIPL
jgi:hypothetical protein